jgi:mevalonate kinase
MAVRESANMSNGASASASASTANNGHAYINGNGPLSNRLKMERKASSPMAPPFMVSAPGKVIVFGEHSVVHGKVTRSLLPLLVLGCADIMLSSRPP